MSTLTVTNIKATGETASRAVSGVAAAWVNFNGTGTIAARDSVNVSSLTDNGTGDYTVNFSNVFGAANYAIAGSAETTVASNSVNHFNLKDNGTFLLAGSLRGEAYYVSSTVNRTNFDFQQISFLAHGDLA